MNNLIKTSITTTFVNYLGAFIGFVIVLFIQTKILSQGQIGTLKLILDKALLVLPFFIIGINSVASRFYFHFEKNKKDYGGFMLLLLLTPAITFVTGFLIFFLSKSNINIDNFYLITIVLLSQLYILIFESYLSTKSLIVIPSFFRNILFRLMFLSLLTIYYFNFINFELLLILYSLQHLIHLFLLAYYLKSNLSFKIDLNFSFLKNPAFKEILTFILFLILGTGSGVMITKIDTVMIEEITKNNDFIGIYAIALAMASIIEMPRRPIVNLVFPIISKKLNENKISEVLILYKKSSINFLIVASTLFSLIWLNIDFIFSIIPSGESYAKGKYVVFFIGLAKLVDLAFGINSEILQSSKYYRWNLILLPILAILSIYLNIYFITKFSYTGAAIATLISFSIFNIIRTLLLYFKMDLNPFNKNYFIVLTFAFIPFILNFFLKTPNLFLNLVLNSFLVSMFFIVPIYKLKLSSDFNDIINKTINASLKLFN